MTQRLNKLISDSGLCSRREADRFIESGRVTINGSIAKLGAIVQEDDKVLVDGFPINIKAVAIRVAKGKQNNAQSTTSNKLSHRAKSILAQQMAAAPKSAALRKTSKNNPANKPKVEEEEIQTPPYKKFYQKGEGYKPSFASKKANSPEREGEEGNKIHSSSRFHDPKSPHRASARREETKEFGAPRFRDSKTSGAGKFSEGRPSRSSGKPFDSKSPSTSAKSRDTKPGIAAGKLHESRPPKAQGKLGATKLFNKPPRKNEK